MKVGQRVKLIALTPELLMDGLHLGQIGVVKEVSVQDALVLGVEFEGHSDSGWKDGLHVVKINTRRDGQTLSVLSLCEICER